MSRIATAFDLAFQHRQAGNLAAAEQLYRQILAEDVVNVGAMHYLAAVCQAQGNLQEAEAYYRRSLQVRPGLTVSQNGLGILFAEQGKFDEAAALFQAVLQAHPGDADAHNNLGLVRLHQNRLDEAIACYHRALLCRPDYPTAQENLNLALQRKSDVLPTLPTGAVLVTPDSAARASALLERCDLLVQQGTLEEARLLLEKTVALYPDLADAHTKLGHVLARLERFADAIVHYQLALQLNPDDFEAHYILAITCHELGNLHEAVAHYQSASRLNTQVPELFNNLGGALLALGRLEEAAAACQQAILLKPDFGEAHSNLGDIFLKQHRLQDAFASIQKALQFRPDLAPARSNFLFSLNYDVDADLDVVFDVHRRWAEAFGTAVPPQSHGNDRSPQRRLRIGYVSPDFCWHALARYFEPILTHHDPQQVEVFCYSDVAKPDAMTNRMQVLAHAWRSTCHMTDAQVAEQIRNDAMDILVDLAGHTACNRLSAFALKPAPVQATWLGYMNTTGLPAIDYRLTDAVLDPPGQPVRDTEELVRLPNGFCCFQPPEDQLDVAPLPASRHGRLTFGSLNNVAKVNRHVLDLWAQVLRALPNSRLLLFHGSLTQPVREQLRLSFEERGIAATRLDLREWSGAVGYLAVYDEIDICLDTFPFTGGVTTCESLWMGVPIISLRGVRPAGRHSTTLLTRVGLADWAVQTPEEYVALTLRMANHLDELAELRAGLRERMRASVCDGRRFTRELEEAYRNMWRRWCEKVPEPPASA